MARILIVDPDDQVADRLRGQFINMGHKCAKEHDGVQALKLAESGKLDMILMEVMLPGLSGFEVCRRIRLKSELYTTLIVFLSNMSSEEEIKHGLAQGADDFIPKPLQVRTVVQRVDALINGRSDAQFKDELTKLPGPKHIKLDVQRAIHRKQRFSIAYIELMNLISLGRKLGNEARAKAIQDMAKGLTVTGQKLETKMFKVGHMGGGHFVAMIDSSLAKTYCKTVSHTWNSYLPRLYESLGHKWVFNPDTQTEGPGNLPLIEVMLCTTEYDPRQRASSQDVFDTLTHLRKKAIEHKESGIITDLRINDVRSEL